jgi:uncharacterized protein (TIGR02996 family)
MSDQDALLAAIAAEPDDDTPRLAYADWLDENDEPTRAEFIRVQVEVARVETLPRIMFNEHIGLFGRQDELLTTRRQELLGPLAGVPATRVEFHRGFVAEVDVRVDAFLRHAAALAAVRPAVRLRVEGVAAAPPTSCGARTSGGHGRVGVRVPARPAARRAADRRRVDRRHEATHPAGELDLEGCGVADGFCELFGEFDLPALTSLDLSQNMITDAGVEALLGTHHPRRLRRLILGGNPITDEGRSRWPGTGRPARATGSKR